MPQTTLPSPIVSMDAAAFEAGLSRMREVVGEAHVFVSEEEVDRRARCLIPRVKRPSAYVYPGSVEEIRSIVEIANKFSLRLWPCSRGKNWGYGSATASFEGAVILVLERMNRILEVNEELAYAVVEPGVTYRQLHRHLHEQRIKLWLDCTDGPADGSVMGNALERGIGETPYGDHFENICGMEVVLPRGELVRTGGGPMENYQSWNVHKWGVGPYLEGLFSQSNYGIVTKIGMWLMPQPEHFLSCIFELRKEEDFPATIDALRRLAFHGALRSKIHMFNDITAFGIIADRPKELLEGKSHTTDEVRAKLRERYHIAPWTFGAGLYGTRAQVRAAKRLVKKELGCYGRLQFMSDFTISVVRRCVSVLEAMRAKPATARWADRIAMKVLRKPLEILQALPHVHAVEQGAPSDYFVKHAYMKSRRPKPADTDIDPARDNCGGIWAGMMAPLQGAAVRSLVDSCFAMARGHGLDLNIALMLANPRSVIVLTSIFYDKDDPEETAKAEALYHEIGTKTQEAGYQQYRTSTAFMSQVLKPAPEFKRLADAIKAALDPNRILAPGKYGIGSGE